jgi:flagellar biosynthetic protein FlhB
MADKPASERTEPPTAERLRKARSQGQVPQSQELLSALTLAALLVLTSLMAADLWHWFTRQVEEGLSQPPSGRLDVGTFVHLFRQKTGQAIGILAPFLAAVSAVSILGGVVVSGWSVAPKALRWDFSRLAPAAGLRTLLSLPSVVHLLVSLVKLAILTVLAVTYVQDKIGLCVALASAPPLAALTASLQLVFGLVVRITIAMMAIAIADAIYQKWQYRRQMRMTRQEVREERREHEGSPIVKGRIRSLHFAIMRRRMLRDVPKADVVVANPTHVAVALKYDAAATAAPVVLAKGAELLCDKIKQIARKHNVPVVEKPELARALYATAEVGQMIPESLYVAVAEVLAMILRMRQQR